MSALHRLLGGALMLSVGVSYLQFEKSILFFPPKKWNAGQPPQRPPPSPPKPGFSSLSQSILGVQIGLILLAMIVTWSSIASLQAKRGLPLGNQVIGWLVLSTTKPLFFFFFHQKYSTTNFYFILFFKKKI